MAPFTGTVHSVYARACNLASGDLVRLAVVTPEIGSVPHGLVVTPPPAFAFTRYVQAGMPVSLRNGVLRIGRLLSIELRGATTWNDDVRQFLVDLAAPAQSNAWQEAWQMLGWVEPLRLDDLHLTFEDFDLVSSCPPPAAPGLGSFPLVSFLSTARRGSASLDVQQIQDLCVSLVGAGPGLTPAGDDFLVGYLAGLWSTAGTDPHRLATVTSLAGIVRQLAGRTNPISRSYLLSAAQGRIAQKLRNLIEQIAQGAVPADDRAGQLLRPWQWAVLRDERA